MNQQVVSSFSDTVLSNNDEIDLGALIGNLWKQRGLIFGFMVACVVLITAYHMALGVMSVPKKVEYPIALTFVQGDNTRYPGGNTFSPNDLKSPTVLAEVLDTLQLDSTMNQLAAAISISYSNSLLKEAEQRLEEILADDNKTPQDTRESALAELSSLRQESQRYITISLKLSSLGLSEDEGVELVQTIVNQWVKTSTEQGLFNVDISRPVNAFDIEQSGNLINSYDEADHYLSALSVAVRSISRIPGTESLTIGGKSLSDLRRDINALENTDIGPLREFAYSNSVQLASQNPSIQVRLLARKRLLMLEQERLTKLIRSYDQALEQMSVTFSQGEARRVIDNGQSNLQLDQSVINALLQMGNQLGLVESRNELFTLRTQTIESLYDLEKEMAILTGVNRSDYGDLNPVDILSEALPAIERRLNGLRSEVEAFVIAYRELVLHSGSQVYIAQAAPLVSGGYIVSLKKILLNAIMAAVMGMMLGLFVALVRIAVK